MWNLVALEASLITWSGTIIVLVSVIVTFTHLGRAETQLPPPDWPACMSRSIFLTVN